jgi:stress-induced morphogen
MAVEVYEVRADAVKKALRRGFPDAENILTEPGHAGRVHARVVSPEFNGLSERRKQELLWKVLREELGEEAQYVTIALAYGTDEYYNEDEI